MSSTLHRQTISKILKTAEASFEKGQTMSRARYREAKDIRNMFSMAVMNEALAKDKPPILIGNFDATQFIITDRNEEMLVTIKKKVNSDDDKEDGEPLTIVEDSSLAHAVKWIMLCNANGNLADYFLISDKSMGADDFSNVS